MEESANDVKTPEKDYKSKINSFVHEEEIKKLNMSPHERKFIKEIKNNVKRML